MPLEIDQEWLQVSKSILQWLGVPSLAGFLGLYAAWITFPPELIIEGVADKSKKFNTKSKIKIKNNGVLPALLISAQLSKLYAVINTNRFENCGG